MSLLHPPYQRAVVRPESAAIGLLSVIFAGILTGILPSRAVAQVPEYSFSGGYGQIEVGGPYAGEEFHG
ncbi:MAG: hypothetical protein WBH55_00070, partial [Bacteroidota bacterium]